MAAEVHLDERALEELLTDPAGPVGRLLQELAEKGAAIARQAAPVRNPLSKAGRAGRNSTARPPGFTKAGIFVWNVRTGRTGSLYAGVNAPGDPSIYLEYPARQMTRKYPFLTTGLDALEGDL